MPHYEVISPLKHDGARHPAGVLGDAVKALAEKAGAGKG